MDDPRHPQRMGLTRKLAGLPSLAEQGQLLDDNNCVVIWTYTEIDQARHSFMDDDVLVAVDEKAFGKFRDLFKCGTEVISAGPRVKKKTGRKTLLPEPATPEWHAIRHMYLHPDVKQQIAVDYAHELGFTKANRHAIGNRIKYEMQQAAKAAAIEGKE